MTRISCRKQPEFRTNGHPTEHKGLEGEPLVSVYIVTHNRRRLLERAINSVIVQSHRNLEIIVVDDFSGDDTKDYLDEISRSDSRIVFTRNGENSGACASRNLAIRMATGDFITGLDDDDYFLQDRVKNFASCWKDFSDSGINPSAIFTDLKVLRSGKEDFIMRLPKKVDMDALKKRNLIGNQVFSKTEYIRAIGGFDVDMPAWQDYETWFRLVSEFGPAYRAPTPSYVVDTNHDSPRLTQQRQDRILLACTKFLEKHGHEFSGRQTSIFKINYYSYPQVPLPMLIVLKAFWHGAALSYLVLFTKKKSRPIFEILGNPKKWVLPR